jgi:tetratricopeptide (TPR) repeat protein
MPTLRIIQQPGSGPNKHQVAVEAEVPGFLRSNFSREIEFALSPQDREKIRWYLEDYLQFDEDPAPQIAARVERLMAERGETLFSAIFDGRNDAMRLWTLVEPHLSSTRIEIITGIAEATSIPWELIRNPHTGVNLALSAKAFVRGQWGGQTVLAPSSVAEKARILLVICRPRAGEDVPFRSVASRIVKGLSNEHRETFQLDVLRPPTYEQLAKELRLAEERGKPYHIVHFDGHGVYADPKSLESHGQILSNVMLKSATTGPHGYLVFEDLDSKTRSKFVDGFAIGGLLRDTGVPILILNACQSGEARPQPRENGPETVREEIDAYGSLAQAVVNAGAAGVVAMRYSVYVVTVAQFVAELYGALARGRTLGEAVAFARTNLASQPNRKIAYEARPLQDWVVPVVWERTPLRLWPQESEGGPLRITLAAAGATAGVLDPELPPHPELGFFGRDETLYELDRAFDRHSVVLLHAYAGSGKTATAAEFARWYALTGGIEGPILFTSFEHNLPNTRPMDKIGMVFGPTLEQSGVHWHAKTEAEKRQIAMEVLKQVPVLWIWDNVEPITGFPAGAQSAWSALERRELHDFLADARHTKAKFLLTSRREEQAWLGEMPRRIRAPAMPMQERLQLAGAIAEHRGRGLASLPDLTPLLQFTLGNPLTILVTVGEALRAGIDTKERLDALVTALRAGEGMFENEEAEGRTKSLGASLSYGFANAFDEKERKRLALLHLFQGSVLVDVLRGMGEAAWALDEVRGLTREQGIDLLDRAAEIGLLVPQGAGYYGVHPALPWYFHDLFARHFSGDNAERACRAFVEAIGGLANVYLDVYDSGNRGILRALIAEEDNLLAALSLARKYGWWDCVINSMQGLNVLYTETGRRPAWRRLVEIATPDFVDAQTGLPLPGRGNQWSHFTDYRVRIAQEERNLVEAERLQRMNVDWRRERAEGALATMPEQRSDRQSLDIRLLAVTVEVLGNVQRDRGQGNCVKSYREAFELYGTIQASPQQAVCALDLGVAYTVIPELHDFDTAERWLQQSMNLHRSEDSSGRAKVAAALGDVSFKRFQDGLAKGRPQKELERLINEAGKNYQQALQLSPPTAIVARAAIHDRLGEVYDEFGDIDLALQHYQQAIRYNEQASEVYSAGRTRANAAFALLQALRLDDARVYAEAALANFRESKDAFYIQQTELMLANIDATAALGSFSAHRLDDARAYAEAALANFRKSGTAFDMVQQTELMLANIDAAAAQEGKL